MVLSLSAFVAIISLEIYRRSEVTAGRSKQAQFKDETRVVMESLAAILQNPETCTQALHNQRIRPGEATQVVMRYKYDTGFLDKEKDTRADREITPGMIIERIEVFTGAPREMVTRISEIPGDLSRYRASLRAVFRGPGVSMVNWRYDEFSGADFGLPFYVWADASDRIVSCYGVNSSGLACNDRGGYYHVKYPPSAPMPAHDVSCRQTVFFDVNPGTPGDNVRGTCRYAGIYPRGNCPASSFPPGSAYTSYSVQVQDSSYGGWPPMDMCLQCQ